MSTKLYKRYKKETGCEPWQLSEAVINTPVKPQAVIEIGPAQYAQRTLNYICANYYFTFTYSAPITIQDFYIFLHFALIKIF